MVVDPAFQWSVVWRITAQSGFTLLLTSIALLFPLVADLAGETTGSDVQVRALVLLYLHDNWWWVATTSLLCAGLASLRLSHQIAGPLVRFKRLLRDLGNARFHEPLRVRDRDYLQTEIAVLNEAASQLAARFTALRATQKELAERLVETIGRTEHHAVGGIQESLQAVKQLVEALGEQLTTGEAGSDAALPLAAHAETEPVVLMAR